MLKIKHLIILLTGNIYSESWNSTKTKVNFFNLKEKVEHILYRLGITKLKSEKLIGYGISEGIMYRYKKDTLVCFGKVDKKITKKFGINQEVFYIDFNWDLVLRLVLNTKIKVSEITKFPNVKRDLSLLIDNKITFEELRKQLKKLKRKF